MLMLRLMQSVLCGAVVSVVLVSAAPAAPARGSEIGLVGRAAGVVAAAGDMTSEKLLRALLDALNSGDRATYLRFLQTNFPARVAGIERDLQFRAMTGGFDIKKIEESSPTKVTALVQERGSDQFARLIMELAGNPPAITNFGLRAIPRPSEFALPHLNESELVAAAQKQVETAVAADQFSGAVLVAKNGRPLFAQAYGLADRERNTPNTLETRFRVGSMNKMFTAVAALQLVQAGKLRLDDSLGTYLPDYLNKDVASKVTIRQLLSHTGGTGDFFGPEYEAHRLELRTISDYLKLFGARAPLFEPGSKFAYSNYGFIVLGAVIEKVSGQNYYDYVRDHVYVPAGMTSTGSEPENSAVPNLSVGYIKEDGHWKTNADTLPYRGIPAGGGYSTVGDFLKFANALQQNKLLDARHLELLTTVQADAKDPSYALGFGTSIVNGIRCFGHGGGAPGMNGELEICPQPGFVVVVLANQDPPAATRLSNFITNRLPEH